MQAVDFGFLFCRAKFHYGDSYEDMMNMPIRAFYFLSNQLSRVLADNDIRAVQVACCSQGGEGVKEYTDLLAKHVGTVTKQEPKLDEAGWEALKNM